MIALSRYFIAFSEACKNLSSWDLMSMPYVISMISAPVTLEVETRMRICNDEKSEGNIQLSVAQEIIGSLSKSAKEPASVFVDGIIEF